jgi:hypothetical protein
MGKVRVSIVSNLLDAGLYGKRTGIVDILFNDIKVIDAVTLTTEITTLEFAADLTAGEHTVSFEVLNTFGIHDENEVFNTIKVLVYQIDISQNEIDYTTIMPDSECAFLHVTDTKNALMSVKINEERDGWILIPSITELEVYGKGVDNTTFTFSINA